MTKGFTSAASWWGATGEGEKKKKVVKGRLGGGFETNSLEKTGSGEGLNLRVGRVRD